MTKQVKLGLGILMAAVVLCCVLLLLPEKKGTIARITVNGVLLHEIPLERPETGDYIDITADDGTILNRICVEPGRIRVEEANCPDQVCVNQGWIQDRALPIVCLPNKLIIEITGGEEEADAVTT